jgi:hypothetical protein
VVLKRNEIDQLNRSREKFNTMGVKDERFVLHRIRRRQVNWVGHILRRYCRLERVIEEKVGDRSDGKTRKKT